MLMPKDAGKRVYNLQSKQIVKLFSRIFKANHQKMLDDLGDGDVSETVAKFFEKSRGIKPMDESSLTIMEVDKWLEELSNVTLEDRQVEHFEAICKKCTADDIKTIIRLIKRDLKMNCGARHVLDALHPDAYTSFQKSRDLKIILAEFGNKAGGTKGSKASKSGLQVMTAISPMLAEPCKDFEKAIKKCPEGFYSEIKYDGERVQIHKQGSDFKFFSRNLKPVMDHKIAQLKDFLPKAFPHGDDLVVDSEILMVDTTTGDPLPFGTLGKHKKELCGPAETCLFIFDCLYFNGEDLTKKPMKDRRKFLEDNMTVIKHRVQLSEYRLLRTKNELVEMTKEVLKKGLEGLVLKGVNTVYEPGKRRWLKVKKDYLMEGAIADTADLVILGAWFGTGKMGGQYSIFLMGCYDKVSLSWKTVTKVHSGLDDLQMERMHKKISPLMDKYEPKHLYPKWIDLASSTMAPNAFAKDPNKMPVFEITGAEFTDSTTHSANSISIRFPRITRIRSDKTPAQATTLKELVHLYEESKAGVNLDELNKLKDSEKSLSDSKNPKRKSEDSEDAEEVQVKKPKVDDSKKPKRKSEDSEDSDAEVPVKVKAEDVRKSKTKSDDEEVPVKKVKVEDNSKSSSEIFKEFLLFCKEEIKVKLPDELRDFEKGGGKLVKDSRKANLVLYEDGEVEGSLEVLRKLHTPHCKHLQVSWLKDSLKSMKPKNPLHYFVKLHQI